MTPAPVDNVPTVTTAPVEPISVEAPASVPAAAGPATTAPRRPTTRPVAPAAGPGRRPAAAVASAWNYSSVVVDVDGIYLPDGTIAAPEPVATIADLAAIGEQFKIGHIAGAGLIVVTTALAAQLELLPTEDALTADLPTGEPPTEDDMVDRIKDFLADQTTFLSNDDGWTADGDTLRAWTRIRRENRAFRIVIEPVVWIWDRRVDSASPFIDLPDVDTDPVGCWRELARRLERLAELLGVPWSTSPGATGEAIYEQIQRSRSRKGGKVLDAAGPIPPADFAGQVRLEGEFAWRRRPAPAELAAAVVVHKYDKRASYLATAGGTDLGFGEPVAHRRRRIGRRGQRGPVRGDENEDAVRDLAGEPARPGISRPRRRTPSSARSSRCAAGSPPPPWCCCSTTRTTAAPGTPSTSWGSSRAGCGRTRPGSSSPGTPAAATRCWPPAPRVTPRWPPR